ncbi:hypothetical protein [Polymorphobacter sp.]|uniref:hypothetical protein n=1 Tax=Polymorphobacter sp. TaxID=1909290 RepID=UPI003F71809B
MTTQRTNVSAIHCEVVAPTSANGRVGIAVGGLVTLRGDQRIVIMLADDRGLCRAALLDVEDAEKLIALIEPLIEADKLTHGRLPS